MPKKKSKALRKEFIKTWEDFVPYTYKEEFEASLRAIAVEAHNEGVDAMGVEMANEAQELQETREALEQLSIAMTQ